MRPELVERILIVSYSLKRVAESGDVSTKIKSLLEGIASGNLSKEQLAAAHTQLAGLYEILVNDSLPTNNLKESSYLKEASPSKEDIIKEQVKIRVEMSNIVDKLSSPTTSLPQKSVLSNKFKTLSKRLFALAALVLSLSVSNPAKAEDTHPRDTTTQQVSNTQSSSASLKLRQLFKYLQKSNTGGINLDMEVKTILPMILSWVDSHIEYGGLSQFKPSKELVKHLMSNGISPKSTLQNASEVILEYFKKVDATECSGNYVNKAGPGSCWIN